MKKVFVGAVLGFFVGMALSSLAFGFSLDGGGYPTGNEILAGGFVCIAPATLLGAVAGATQAILTEIRSLSRWLQSAHRPGQASPPEPGLRQPTDGETWVREGRPSHMP
jgi:hypothetical protein